MTKRALEILIAHANALDDRLHKAQQVKPRAVKEHEPQNYETALRQRMIDELRQHTDRAGTSHKHFWERLHQHASPTDLASLIQTQGHALFDR